VCYSFFWPVVPLEYCIKDVKDVLVVVTRYFGGTLLGADRFKHINQAARDALELGGFIETKYVASESRTRGFKK
jgi:hypothetical protein